MMGGVYVGSAVAVSIAVYPMHSVVTAVDFYVLWIVVLLRWPELPHMRMRNNLTWIHLITRALRMTNEVYCLSDVTVFTRKIESFIV